jgi:hypothetical protein
MFTHLMLQVKLSGVMDKCSVFDQLAVCREVDFFKLWMPFVGQSNTVAEISRVEVLSYLEVTLRYLFTQCDVYITSETYLANN